MKSKGQMVLYWNQTRKVKRLAIQLLAIVALIMFIASNSFTSSYDLNQIKFLLNPFEIKMQPFPEKKNVQRWRENV